MSDLDMAADFLGEGRVADLFPDFGAYLTFREAIKSATAIRKGITNVPTSEHYGNMVRTYHNVIVPLFDRFGKLPITSFYRSPALNKAIGGSKTSAHMLGQAVDIDCDGLKTISNNTVFAYVRADLDFDQLILENPDSRGNAAWVHIGYRSKEANRRQVLKMIWRNGKQIYEVMQ
ncbi:peptidase M15 [Fibrisoma montanum]|uniref:Peptidase M15 n=1 Tax=Fibrisoma montanum TaxID=2305895 RepID=A0A418MB46_9BACT|nr:D-Ala-D-Ala carboxypeptidase family metallohydrolase [Fibrisoma montanum]RIV23591.1 peptidase M15 [Fibrisoma montanum]